MAETEKWIRPSGDVPWGQASYGTGDGSSYANAYAGPTDPAIVWTNATVWWIVGSHAPSEDTNHVNRWIFRNVEAGGTLTQPRIFRFDWDLVNEPGIVWGGSFKPEAWSLDGADAGGNTYKQTRDSSSSGVAFDLTNNGQDHAMLAVGTSAANVYATEGSWWSDGVTTWAHIVGGADPTDRLIMPSDGYNFKFTKNFNKLHMMFCGGSIYNIGRINEPEDNMTGVQFRRMNLSYVTPASHNSVIEILPRETDESTERLVVYRCNISHGWGAGVGFGADAGGFPDTVDVHGIQVNNCVIVRNFIHDIQIASFFDDGSSDAHAVGIQNGEGHIISKNVTEQTGASIVLFCVRSAQTGAHMRNILIRQNSIRDTHDSGGVGSTIVGGIEITDQSGVADCSGNIVEFNSVHDLLVGGTRVNQAYKLGATGLANIVKFEDNVADTVAIGYNETSSARYTKSRRLTVNNPVTAFVSAPAMDAGRIDFDLNTYIEGGTPPTNQFSHGGGQTLAQWQANGALYDPNSAVT